MTSPLTIYYCYTESIFIITYATNNYYTHTNFFICHYKILPKLLILDLLSIKPNSLHRSIMKTSCKNFNSKFLPEESLRKIFVSSLSFPTFLAQSTGYLPLSFDKSSNSLQFKFLSLPMLFLIFHSALSVTWICFNAIQNTVIMSDGSNKKAFCSFGGLARKWFPIEFPSIEAIV